MQEESEGIIVHTEEDFLKTAKDLFGLIYSDLKSAINKTIVIKAIDIE